MSDMSEKDLEARLRDLNAARQYPASVREAERHLEYEAAVDAATWYQYAIALMRTGKFREASDVYYGKLRSSPGYNDEVRADWIREVGIDMLRRGEIGGATHAFEDALAIHRSCGSSHRLTDEVMIALTFLPKGPENLALPRITRVFTELAVIKLSDPKLFESSYSSIERLANWWYLIICAANKEIEAAVKAAKIVAESDASIERQKAALKLLKPGSNNSRVAEGLVREALKQY